MKLTVNPVNHETISITFFQRKPEISTINRNETTTNHYNTENQQ
ncbi:hypothetical protein GE061_014687, partial [Apolygus lucorum]